MNQSENKFKRSKEMVGTQLWQLTTSKIDILYIVQQMKYIRGKNV